MIRKIWSSALAAALAVIIFSCDTGQNTCSNISGTFTARKDLSSLACRKSGHGVKVQISSGIIPSASSLSITQTSCDLLATEEVTAGSLKIPYTGEINTDDQFTLQIQNPGQLAIPLKLEIGGAEHECSFNGSIVWDGDQSSSNNLSGKITYDLDRRKDETDAACPNSCELIMDFNAIR